MIPLLAPTFLTALLLGARHALDADHVVAVTTIVSRTRSLRHAAVVGLLWGLGHTLTLLVAGLAALALGVALPVEITRSFEGIVGGMLILLGLLTLREYRRKHVHLHTHRHGGQEHLHFHAHPHGQSSHTHIHPEWVGFRPMGVGFRPMVVGMVHGLAGSAALLVLAVGGMPSPPAAMAFIGAFGLGSTAGMATVTAALCLPVLWGERRFPALQQLTALAAGVAGIALGAVILAENLH